MTLNQYDVKKALALEPGYDIHSIVYIPTLVTLALRNFNAPRKHLRLIHD